MKEALHRFVSLALGNERTIWIRKPRDLATNIKLLLILDAELYRDGVGAPAIIDELDEKENIGEVLTVYVSYCDSDARWLECPCYPPFATFIIEELYPWLIEEFPSMVEAEDRIIVGLSYTGLAASYVALQAKGLFNKVISQSGSYWSNDCWLTREYERTDDHLSLSFYLDVGDQEVEINVEHKEGVFQEISQIEGVERFRDVLIRKGCDVRYDIFSGGHSCEAWALTLPSALEWALLQH